DHPLRGARHPGRHAPAWTAAQDEAVAHLRSSLHPGSLWHRGRLPAGDGGAGAGAAHHGGRGGSAAMMKYVFVLVLLLVGGIGGVQLTALVYRWNHDMIQSQVVKPGEMNFAMAPGSLPRTGSQLYYA